MADAFFVRLFTSPFINNASPSFTNFVLDQNTDKWETVFQSQEALTITRLGVRQGAVTGTSPQYRISLQGVDSSANPDGTIKGGGSPASTTFTPVGGTDNTFQWFTLDNTYVTTRGESLAVVVDYSSGTIDGSNNCSFTSRSIGLGDDQSVPFTIQNDNGSRARQTNVGPFSYGTASKAYGMPISSLSHSLYNTGTTPDEVGIKFTLPSGWWNTYEVAGIMWYGRCNGSDVILKLYDTDGSTVLQQTTIDTDMSRAVSSTILQRSLFTATTLSTLASGSAYRLTLTPTVASPNMTLTDATFPSSADIEAWPLGSNIIRTERTDAGSWTDTNTNRPAIHLLLKDITAPAGGTGMLIHSGMTGGVRG